jgi:hypothetical protein
MKDIIKQFLINLGENPEKAYRKNENYTQACG